jgi:hypothetical protein
VHDGPVLEPGHGAALAAAPLIAAKGDNRLDTDIG